MGCVSPAGTSSIRAFRRARVVFQGGEQPRFLVTFQPAFPRRVRGRPGDARDGVFDHDHEVAPRPIDYRGNDVQFSIDRAAGSAALQAPVAPVHQHERGQRRELVTGDLVTHQRIDPQLFDGRATLFRRYIFQVLFQERVERRCLGARPVAPDTAVHLGLLLARPSFGIG